jgi:UDP-N-acetylmuramyl pentapeptide synthase
MLELGSAERIEHEEVGCRAAVVADFVIAVGQRAGWIAQSAIECGLDKSHVFSVPNNAEALNVLSEIVTQRSAILVKGSRGMQMEAIVEGLGRLAIGD